MFDRPKKIVNTSKRYAHAKEWLNKSAHGDVVLMKYLIKQIFAGYILLENFISASNIEIAEE